MCLAFFTSGTNIIYKDCVDLNIRRKLISNCKFNRKSETII